MTLDEELERLVAWCERVESVSAAIKRCSADQERIERRLRERRHSYFGDRPGLIPHLRMESWLRDADPTGTHNPLTELLRLAAFKRKFSRDPSEVAAAMALADRALDKALDMLAASSA